MIVPLFVNLMLPEGTIELEQLIILCSKRSDHKSKIEATVATPDGQPPLPPDLAGFLDIIPRTIPGKASVDLIEMLKDTPVNNDGKTLGFPKRSWRQDPGVL